MARRRKSSIPENTLAGEYAKLSYKEQAALRKVRRSWNFENEANHKMHLASRWMGPLARITQVAGFAAVLAAAGCVYAVYSRPAPLALVSFPDGSLRCAQPNFDPQLNTPLARTPSDDALCRSLEPPAPLAQRREQVLPDSVAPAVSPESVDRPMDPNGPIDFSGPSREGAPPPAGGAR